MGRIRALVAALAVVASALVVVVGAAPASAATLTRAYVTNFSSDTLSVIDTASHTVVATIGVGNGPIGVAVAQVTIPDPLADLLVTKTCDPGPVAPGSVVNCSVTVTNAGPNEAQNVSVTDDLPPGLSLVGTPGSGGFSCGVGDPFTCTLGSLAPNTSAAFSFSTTVSGDVTPGSILSNPATVSASTPDPNSANNTASASTSVVACTIRAPATSPAPPATT